MERQAALKTEEQPAGSAGVSAVLRVEEPEVDLASLDERTRKLVNSMLFAVAAVGLWLIYSDVLPALAAFDEMALWSYSGAIDGREQLIPVTLADIGVVAIILIVTTIASKNLPALLEILLLQRISIAFPQRDVHLSAAEPLDVRVHHSSSGMTDSDRRSRENNAALG